MQSTLKLITTITLTSATRTTMSIGIQEKTNGCSY